MMMKIQKTSKAIIKVLSVLFWLCIVVLVYVEFKTVLLLAGVGASNAALDTTLAMGNYKLTLANGYDWRNNPTTLTMYISIILTGVFACYEIKVLKEVFTPMANGLPFQGSVSKSIRKMAWVVLIYGAAGTAVNCISSMLLYKFLDIPSLFSPERVSECSLSIVSSGDFVIVFVLLILLSRIFEYGEELQQLSDETL